MEGAGAAAGGGAPPAADVLLGGGAVEAAAGVGAARCGRGADEADGFAAGRGGEAVEEAGRRGGGGGVADRRGGERARPKPPPPDGRPPERERAMVDRVRMKELAGGKREGTKEESRREERETPGPIGGNGAVVKRQTNVERPRRASQVAGGCNVAPRLDLSMLQVLRLIMTASRHERAWQFLRHTK